MTEKIRPFMATMVVSFVVICLGLEATELSTEDVTEPINNISAAYDQNRGIEALYELHNLRDGGDPCILPGETYEMLMAARERHNYTKELANYSYVHARWLEYFCKTESIREFYGDAADIVEKTVTRFRDSGFGLAIPSELPVDAIYRHGKELLDRLVEMRHGRKQTREYTSTWSPTDTFQRAIQLYLFAASYAHPEAQFQLGELYSGNLHREHESPLPNIVYDQYRDEDQAGSWYLASAAMGHLKAREVLRERQRGLNIEGNQRNWIYHAGTAFYIAKDTLLTAAHVARACNRGRTNELEKYLRFYEDGRLFSVNVNRLDNHADLAELKLDQLTQDRQPVAPLGCGAWSGNRVFALGFPLVRRDANYWSVHPHVTSGIVSNERGTFGRNTTFLFSGPTAAGQSGGPVVDENFHVVGVMTNQIDNFVTDFSIQTKRNYTVNLNEATSMNRIHALLKTSCVEERKDSSLGTIKKSVRPLHCYYDANSVLLEDLATIGYYYDDDAVPAVCDDDSINCRDSIVENQRRWMEITRKLDELRKEITQIAE